MEKSTRVSFIFFKVFIGIYGLFSILRYWYWGYPQIHFPNASFVDFWSPLTLTLLLKLSLILMIIGFLGLFLKRFYKFFAILAISGQAILLYFDPARFGSQLGLLTIFLIAILLSFNASTPSKYTLFIIKLAYIFSVGFMGIYRITNTTWNSGQWLTTQLEHIGNESIVAYIFSFSPIKWNLIILIPIIELSVFFLVKNHTFIKQHLYLLLCYHLFVFFILTTFNAPQDLYWISFLQISCLLFFIPYNTHIVPKKEAQNTLISSASTHPTSFKPSFLLPSLLIFVMLQCIIPLWPYIFFHEDINWTRKGDHFAWRMKINTYTHDTTLMVINKKTQEKFMCPVTNINPLSNSIKYSPYALIYYAKELKKSLSKEDIDVSVYSNAFCSLNARPYYRYIDPNVDLSTVTYHYFIPNQFVLPIPSEEQSSL